MERKSFNEELKKKEELEAKQHSGENEELKLDDAKRVKVLSPGQLVFKRFIRNKLAIFGSIVLICMFLFSFLVPVFYPYTQTQIFHKYEYAYGLYGVADIRQDYTNCKYPLDAEAEELVSSEAKRNVSSGIKLMDGQGYDHIILFSCADCSEKGADTRTYVLQKLGNMDYTVSLNDGGYFASVGSNQKIGTYDKFNMTASYLGEPKDEAFEAALASSVDKAKPADKEGTFTVGGSDYTWRRDNKTTYSFYSAEETVLYQGESLGASFDAAALEAFDAWSASENENANLCFSVDGKDYFLQTVKGKTYANIVEVKPGEAVYVSSLLTYSAIAGSSDISNALRNQLLLHAYSGEDISYAGYDYIIRDEGEENQLTVFVKRFEAHDDSVAISDELRAQLTSKDAIGQTFTEDGNSYAVSEQTRLAVRCTDAEGNVTDFYADDRNVDLPDALRAKLSRGGDRTVTEDGKTYVVTEISEFLLVEVSDAKDDTGEVIDTFDARDASADIPADVRARLVDNNGEDESGFDYTVYKTQKEIAELEGGEWTGSAEEGAEQVEYQTVHYHIVREPLLSVTTEEGIPVGYLSNFVVRDTDGLDMPDADFKESVKKCVYSMQAAKERKGSFTYQFKEEKSGFHGYEPYKEAILDENGNPVMQEVKVDVEQKVSGYEVSCEHWKYLIDLNGGPSSRHAFGTDPDGMDILARMMYGGQISLIVGFIVVIIETLLGVIMGGIAGYFGGWVDNLIMRLVDIFYCIPSMPILIIMGSFMDAAKLGTYERLAWMMAILGVLGWAGVARLVRGQILSLREQEFMVAAEATGVKVRHRIFRHLLPNVMPQLIVTATAGLGGVILTESTLSFLGLGVKHPLATWGTMINSVTSSNENLIKYTYIWIPVGLLICLTVIAFNFVGDGLRDAFDPKMKR